jgi:hypothetical protein
MFGALSVFGHRIKGMMRLRPEHVWTCNVTSPPSAPLPFFPFVMLLTGRVVRICSAVRFLERLDNYEMEWTQESVIEFIELCNRKEIFWDPKHPMHFNKIRKQDAWEELGKEMNRPVDECVSANLSWTLCPFFSRFSLQSN